MQHPRLDFLQEHFGPDVLDRTQAGGRIRQVVAACQRQLRQIGEIFHRQRRVCHKQVGCDDRLADAGKILFRTPADIAKQTGIGRVITRVLHQQRVTIRPCTRRQL